MNIQEKQLVRMELQIGELIRIVANINERLTAIENRDGKRTFIQQIPVVHNNGKKKTPRVEHL